MNGRIFDPVLARFLSADPNIDGVSDSQGYNRYSYVHNNPLNATDPSGYLSLKEIGVIVAAVVAAVFTAGAALYALSTYTCLAGVSYSGIGAALGAIASGSVSLGGAIIAGAAGGFASGFAGSLLNGGSIGDAFKAGVIGAAVGGVSAGLAHEIGTLPTKYEWFNSMKWAAHGLAQGLVTEAAGGEFRHGFYAGFGTAAMAGPIGNIGSEAGDVGEIVAAAVVGGTASSLGGGKFANGAVSGAFTHLFNAKSHPKAPNWKKMAKGVKTIDEAKVFLKQQADAGIVEAAEAYAILTRSDVKVEFATDLAANGVTSPNWSYSDADGWTQTNPEIYIKSGLKGTELLSTLVHETQHVGAIPGLMPFKLALEVDAHSYEESYRIASRFPNGPGPMSSSAFRKREGAASFQIAMGYATF